MGIPRKILVMGLPGAGKTYLARRLAKYLNAEYLSGDEMRQSISSDLGFSLDDCITHAGRMGARCDSIVRDGRSVVADFVCPTPETRKAFGPCFLVWVDTIRTSRDGATNQIFVPPERMDYVVTTWRPNEALFIRNVISPNVSRSFILDRETSWQPDQHLFIGRLAATGRTKLFGLDD